MIKLHNTLTRNLDEFKPLSGEQVTLYTCGPTVYDHLQVGNWTSYIRWDTLVRVLKSNDFVVKRIMNITDVGHLVSDADEGEDKLEKGARREGKTAWEVAKQYTDEFLEGMDELKLLPPDKYAKATEHIPEQIALIKTLEDRGYTYGISDGVYFDTSKFPKYADFARLDLADQKAGARVKVNPEKRNPSDFALWKFSPVGHKRDMEWQSPWGMGFPGWHLECSAMAMKYLGETIDIHTGGIDHIPVHHTNEIAQSEAATGKRFANYWLHNNFLLVDGTKISKSLNNGFTIKDLSDREFSALDFKMFVLQSHYRTESNFTWDNLSAAKNRLSSLKNMAAHKFQINDSKHWSISESEFDEHVSKINAALNEDLNTPKALAELSIVENLVADHGVDSVIKEKFEKFLATIDELLGLDIANQKDISDDLKKIIHERENARKNQDWQKADELRDKLNEKGIDIKDTAHGPIWSRY
jgi:cysteinyl-tRNA synthetase